MEFTVSFDYERFRYYAGTVFLPWHDVGKSGVRSNELSSCIELWALPDGRWSVQAALHQQTDVAGLLEHVVTGLRAASGKNHLPRKQDFRPAGKALQKMKSWKHEILFSCFLEILKYWNIAVLFSILFDWLKASNHVFLKTVLLASSWLYG